MRVSVSKLKTFKACRRAYQLKYIYDLVPVETSDALVTGSSYHEKVEKLYRGTQDDSEDDFSKSEAMLQAYKKYVYPMVPISAGNVEVEVNQTIRVGGINVDVIGRLDGVADDGTLVEHKTVSAEITEQYEYDLQWDEQLLMYMLLTGARKCYYTVCRKPTIRQKRGESDEEFFHRMVSWYDEDTDSKIRLFLVERTDAEIMRYEDELQSVIAEVVFCESMSKHYYKNALHCFRWGRRCEYAEICQHYDPNQDYINFKKGGRVNEESADIGSDQFF